MGRVSVESPRRVLAAWSCLGLIFMGCGGESVDHPDTVPVTGKVTLDGQPVEGANITLRPAGQEGETYPARAVSGTDGTFTVRTFFSASHDVEGAVPGKYQISVTKLKQSATAPVSHDATSVPSPTDAGHQAMAKGRRGSHAAVGGGESGNVLPSQYENPLTSGLETEVKAGAENSIALELKSK